MGISFFPVLNAASVREVQFGILPDRPGPFPRTRESLSLALRAGLVLRSFRGNRPAEAFACIMTDIDGLLDGALKIRLAAPPVDGAANAAARDFLAEAAGLRRSEVVLLSGEKSRNKTFLLRGLPPEQARQKLLG